MWVFTPHGFISIVEYQSPKAQPGEELLVRSRDAETLPKLFGPDLVVKLTPKADYRYRIIVSRQEAQRVLLGLLGDINYPNFKRSLPEGSGYKEAAGKCWGVMYDYQNDNWLPSPHVVESFGRKW
jgi:hypothetical protein